LEASACTRRTPQYEAGERLRADYWFAHLSPRVTSNWSALAPSERSRRGAPANAAVLRDEVIAAKERVMRALMAVGPEVAGVLVDLLRAERSRGGGEGEWLAAARRQGRAADRLDAAPLRLDPR
jgi:hypothetical protein